MRALRFRQLLLAAAANMPVTAFVLLPTAQIRLMSRGGDGFFLRRAAVLAGERQRNVFLAFGLCCGGRPAVIAGILCTAVLAGADVLVFVFRVCGIAAKLVGLCLADLFSVFIVADLDASAVAEILPMALGVRAVLRQTACGAGVGSVLLLLEVVIDPPRSVDAPGTLTGRALALTAHRRADVPAAGQRVTQHQRIMILQPPVGHGCAGIEGLAADGIHPAGIDGKYLFSEDV